MALHRVSRSMNLRRELCGVQDPALIFHMIVSIDDALNTKSSTHLLVLWS